MKLSTLIASVQTIVADIKGKDLIVGEAWYPRDKDDYANFVVIMDAKETGVKLKMFFKDCSSPCVLELPKSVFMERFRWIAQGAL